MDLKKRPTSPKNLYGKLRDRPSVRMISAGRRSVWWAWWGMGQYCNINWGAHRGSPGGLIVAGFRHGGVLGGGEFGFKSGMSCFGPKRATPPGSSAREFPLLRGGGTRPGGPLTVDFEKRMPWGGGRMGKGKKTLGRAAEVLTDSEKPFLYTKNGI